MRKLWMGEMVRAWPRKEKGEEEEQDKVVDIRKWWKEENNSRRMWRG